MGIQIIRIKQKSYLRNFFHKSGPFLFVLCNTSILLIANLFLRSQNISPPDILLSQHFLAFH